MNADKHHIFISYAHADFCSASKLRHALERFSIKVSGHSVSQSMLTLGSVGWMRVGWKLVVIGEVL